MKSLPGMTPCMLCVQIYFVVCIGLLSAEFSTANTGLGRPMFCKAQNLIRFLQRNNSLVMDFLFSSVHIFISRAQTKFTM